MDYGSVGSVIVSVVLFMDIIPTIEEYISAAALVSPVGGVCTIMESPTAVTVHDSISDECLTKQIVRYYDISAVSECNCCGKYQHSVIKNKHELALSCCKDP